MIKATFYGKIVNQKKSHYLAFDPLISISFFLFSTQVDRVGVNPKDKRLIPFFADVLPPNTIFTNL